MLLEKKKNKLVARANNDQSVNTLSNKYKMRIEYIPNEFEADTNEDTRVKINNLSHESSTIQFIVSTLQEMEKFSQILFYFSFK